MKIGIIGAGNLGKSIIDCLVKNNINPLVSDNTNHIYRGIEILHNNIELAKESNVIILTVKPFAIGNVLKEIDKEIKAKLIISFAAGLPLKHYESKINAKFVRAMTNLAVKNSQGMTVYKIGNKCSSDERLIINKLFSYFGNYLELEDESLIDLTTALSGSGIAYFIKIFETFIKTATENGMNHNQAKKIILETVKGSVSLMDNANIINCIATKGGTTQQGLKEFEKRNLDLIISDVILKTIQKCKIIGAKND